MCVCVRAFAWMRAYLCACVWVNECVSVCACAQEMVGNASQISADSELVMGKDVNCLGVRAIVR